MNKNSVEVSVFFVAYNEEKYISKALDSILCQKTTFRFEIICHDDASKDNTPNIILEYSKKYDNIVPILQKENQCQKGLNITLEFMYKVAHGKYIAYCDGDDYWTDPYKLQKQYDFLENNKDYVMCLHNFLFLYETKKDKTILSSCGKKEKDFSTEEMIMWKEGIPQIGTCLFYKDLAFSRPIIFQKIGGGSNSKRAISDYPLYIYFSLIGKVHYFPSSMSIWRRRKTGTWGSEINTEKVINFYNDMIIFLTELNRYTDSKFEKTINKKNNYLEFEIAYLQQNYKKAHRLSKHIKIPFKTRLVCFIGSISKRIASTIRRIK